MRVRISPSLSLEEISQRLPLSLMYLVRIYLYIRAFGIVLKRFVRNLSRRCPASFLPISIVLILYLSKSFDTIIAFRADNCKAVLDFCR